MSKRVLTVDWKSVNGATPKRRILHLRKSEDGVFLCPVKGCLHVPFKSSRGTRKHITTIHPWFYHFNEQPAIDRSIAENPRNTHAKNATNKMPAFSFEIGSGKEFLEWLQTPCGGGKSRREATLIARRAMKFLMASLCEPEGETNLQEEYIDCCVGSPTIVMDFLKLITDEWKLRSSSALTYMKAISDLLDFRKAQGVPDDTLRTFTVTEVYIRRGKENLAKKKKIEYARNLDLESLISRNSWATIQEMEEVIPYHTPKYQYVLKKCQNEEQQPSLSDLTFATRFIVTFLFLRVKCTRPMSYQYLTIQMLESAKRNGGFINQTAFKTEDTYGFDTLIMTEDVLDILATYIQVIRPLLCPSCDYLILTTNGTQYKAFGMAMSLLVYQAIGKSINPTRYRQIVETESSVVLTSKEREVLSKDQKHSSYVAKRSYQKQLSREVAMEGRTCMQKMIGTAGDQHTKDLAVAVKSNISPPPTTSSFHQVPSTSAITSKTVNVNSEADTSLCDGGCSRGCLHETDKSRECVDLLTVDGGDESALSVETSKESNLTVFSDVSNAAVQNSCLERPDAGLTDLTLHTRGTISISPLKKTDIESRVSDSPILDTAAKNPISTDDIEVKREDLEKEMSHQTRFIRFTPEEDSFLRDGVKKYGLGRWSQILKDVQFHFHKSRTRDSLRMRAETIRLSKKRKSNRDKK